MEFGTYHYKRTVSEINDYEDIASLSVGKQIGNDDQMLKLSTRYQIN